MMGCWIKGVVTGLCAVVLTSCGTMPNATKHGDGVGSVSVAVRIRSAALAKRARTHATSWDSLRVAVSGEDMASRAFAFGRDGASDGMLELVLDDIPAGEDRLVEVWTTDEGGDTIHGIESNTCDIAPNAVAEISVMLMPGCGSLYLHFSGVPTSIDSVFAQFVSDADGSKWESRVRRSPKISLSIDRIPDNTAGVLTVAAVDTTGDTLYRASLEMTYEVGKMLTVPIDFNQTPGELILVADIVEPGVTVALGGFDQPPVDTQELGELIITEIMYTADDSEYVELYNPSTVGVSYDTLILEIDGTYRYFADISVSAGGFFVVGRGPLTWADTWHTTQGALNFSTTTGNWLTLRTADSTVLDRVVIAPGDDDVEWPSLSGPDRSVVLDSLCADPRYNNFGRHWIGAETAIDQSVTDQRGTPGVPGA